jgi:holliday junction DNA helicase RuvA
MIAYLQGKVRHQPEGIIVLCHGVGYGVHVSARTAQNLVDGQEVELFIYTHVREEALELFGFVHREEQSLFQLLLDVSGVGPKTALQIINFAPTEIINAVQQADTGFFSQVPRVGKKLAQKIIIELRSKLGALKELDLQPLSPWLQEVKEALLQLGFPERDIEHVLPKLGTEEMSTSAAIKTALNLLQPKNA